MRGPKHKPNKIKKLTGSRVYNPNGLEPSTGKPIMPAWLSPYAKTEWRYITPKLDELGLLATVDRAVLATYCEAVGSLREATEALQRENNRLVIKTTNGNYIQNPWVSIRNKAMADVVKYAVEFGMTPSARSRFEVKPEKRMTLVEELLGSIKENQ